MKNPFELMWNLSKNKENPDFRNMTNLSVRTCVKTKQNYLFINALNWKIQIHFADQWKTEGKV